MAGRPPWRPRGPRSRDDASSDFVFRSVTTLGTWDPTATNERRTFIADPDKCSFPGGPQGLNGYLYVDTRRSLLAFVVVTPSGKTYRALLHVKDVFGMMAADAPRGRLFIETHRPPRLYRLVTNQNEWLDEWGELQTNNVPRGDAGAEPPPSGAELWEEWLAGVGAGPSPACTLAHGHVWGGDHWDRVLEVTTGGGFGGRNVMLVEIFEDERPVGDLLAALRRLHLLPTYPEGVSEPEPPVVVPHPSLEQPHSAGWHSLVTVMEGMRETAHVPFALEFSVHALLSSGVLRPTLLDGEFAFRFMEIALNSDNEWRPQDVEAALLALSQRSRHEPISDVSEIRDAIRAASVARVAGIKSSPAFLFDDGRVDPRVFVMRRATVTPLRILFHAPEPTVANRVLRKFRRHASHFMRVTFSEENLGSFAPQDQARRAWRGHVPFSSLFSSFRSHFCIGGPGSP